jgi:ABC-type transport system involved in multi-copper enzyme maturation permease subunit
MNKQISFIILMFWIFSILTMLGVTINFRNTEPILTIFGFIGFLIFLGSGFDLIFPLCLKSFKKVDAILGSKE